jgi:hypothetical protein
MNEQLQAQLSQVLAQIMVSVGEVKNFSVAQLPDIVQQYIQYGIYSSILYSAITLNTAERYDWYDIVDLREWAE